MNWEVILWTGATVAVLAIICSIVVSIISARNMHASRENMKKLQEAIKVGAHVLFGGGIYGKIVGIKEDVIEVEISKGLTVKISRYAIQTIVD